MSIFEVHILHTFEWLKLNFQMFAEVKQSQRELNFQSKWKMVEVFLQWLSSFTHFALVNIKM